MFGRALTLMALFAVIAAAICAAGTCDAADRPSEGFQQNHPWEHPGDPFSDPPMRPGPGGPPMMMDASGFRDVSPRGMIMEYAGMFAEKERLESFGNRVYVLDPRLFESPDDQLSRALTEIMGGDVVPDAGSIDGVRVPVPEPKLDGRFLELMLEKVQGTGTELEALLLDMLRETDGAETEASSAPETRVDAAEVPSDDETDDAPRTYDPLPAAVVTQEEEFLRSSLFDGGTSFSA
jgi:hypothetical protein